MHEVVSVNDYFSQPEQKQNSEIIATFNTIVMPNQRLRRILKDLEVSVASSSIQTTSTRDFPDKHDDLPKKRVMLNNTSSSSCILLQAIEFSAMKKRKYTSEKQQTTTVHLANNDNFNNDASNDKSNDDKDTRIGTNEIIDSIHELRNVYLYGLQTVSKLQDLRDAPDAILPGNFCDTK